MEAEIADVSHTGIHPSARHGEERRLRGTRHDLGRAGDGMSQTIQPTDADHEARERAPQANASTNSPDAARAGHVTNGEAQPTPFPHTHHGHGLEVPEMSSVVLGLLRRLRLPWLLRHYARSPVLAIFSIFSACVSLGIIAVVAAITGTPLIIPSLGPSAFLFFYSPSAPAASPRHTILGQCIGVGAGYVSLLITGYHFTGVAARAQVNWAAVFSAGIALALTVGLMVLLHVEHPPAVSTALIVALGALREPYRLLLLLVAVVLLVGQAIVINRLAGVDYPLWSPRPSTCQPRILPERASGDHP